MRPQETRAKKYPKHDHEQIDRRNMSRGSQTRKEIDQALGDMEDEEREEQEALDELIDEMECDWVLDFMDYPSLD